MTGCGSDYVKISLAWIVSKTYILECGIFHHLIHVDALKHRICGQFLSMKYRTYKEEVMSS